MPDKGCDRHAHCNQRNLVANKPEMLAAVPLAQLTVEHAVATIRRKDPDDSLPSLMKIVEKDISLGTVVCFQYKIHMV